MLVEKIYAVNDTQAQLAASEAMVASLQEQLEAMNETCQSNSTNTTACAAVEAELLVCQQEQAATNDFLAGLVQDLVAFVNG